MSADKSALLLLGNQLFPVADLPEVDGRRVFLCEDMGLCTYVRHHQQKIVLFLAAMREYADQLRQRDYKVTYCRLEPEGSAGYEEKLAQFVARHNLDTLVHFEIEDHFFADRMAAFCRDQTLTQRVLPSPMFLTARSEFADYLGDRRRPSMGHFYQRQRRRLDILVDADGSPQGGRWSYDEDNRKKLPASVEPPALPNSQWSEHTRDVVALVARHFADHPGRAEDFWWPVTRRSALHWLRDFLESRLACFGPFEDAISQRSDTLFHSVLAPVLNLGLITPAEIVERTLAFAQDNDVPLNSLEGFIRQMIGWREFIRGIYHHYDEQQASANFWGHQRGLTAAWYTGDTGIPPLDDAIKTAVRLGWSHHIQRLMVVGNLMNLSEIEPLQVHTWFMETHVDSSDWVMGPNVYGMALFSDGGIFATKPYICGSNYLRKMSDYGKGDWCDVVDGLYWRFIDRHREFFAGNHRLAMTVRTLDRLDGDRKQNIFTAAEKFLDRHTQP